MFTNFFYAFFVKNSLNPYPKLRFLGSPLFKKATLHLENGNKIEITAPNNNKDRRYVQKMTVNGVTHTKNYLTHDLLMNGAKIDYQMSETANKQRGIRDEDFPYSFSRELKQK